MTAEHGQDSATTLSLIGDFESTKHTGSLLLGAPEDSDVTEQ